MELPFQKISSNQKKMIIQINDTDPIETFQYQMVAQGGRNKQDSRTLATADLPIYLGTIEDLTTTELDYLIIASDLQGNIINNKVPILLGELLPDFLKLLFEIQFPTIDHQRVGVLLCGDLYARLDKRGGLGDVKNVWHAFNQHFGFVAGVAGNHDDFGDNNAFEQFKSTEDIYYLDGQIKKIAGLNIGGISGIIGRPTKPFRKEESSHLKMLGKLLRKQPDILLLHEGPNHLDPKMKGNENIREVIERGPKTVICCGHNHWKQTLVEKENGTQIINADAKCIILAIKQVC